MKKALVLNERGELNESMDLVIHVQGIDPANNIASALHQELTRKMRLVPPPSLDSILQHSLFCDDGDAQLGAQDRCGEGQLPVIIPSTPICASNPHTLPQFTLDALKILCSTPRECVDFLRHENALTRLLHASSRTIPRETQSTWVILLEILTRLVVLMNATHLKQLISSMLTGYTRSREIYEHNDALFLLLLQLVDACLVKSPLDSTRDIAFLNSVRQMVERVDMHSTVLLKSAALTALLHWTPLDTTLTRQFINSDKSDLIGWLISICGGGVESGGPVEGGLLLLLMKLWAVESEVLLNLVPEVLERFRVNSKQHLVASIHFMSLVFPVSSEWGGLLFQKSSPLILHTLKSTTTAMECKAAALELVSLACADQSSRKIIFTDFFECLKGQNLRATTPPRSMEGGLGDTKDAIESARRVQALTRLILSKLHAVSEVKEDGADEQVFQGFLGTLMDVGVDGRALSSAVEGLAFLSTQPDVQELITRDAKLLDRLLELSKPARPLDQQPAPISSSSTHRGSNLSYGCLVIFLNLTTFRVPLTSEEEQLVKLKDFASNTNSSSTLSEKSPRPHNHPMESDEAVRKRISTLLSHSLCAVLSHHALAPTTSRNLRAIVAKIYLNCACDGSHHGRLVQQGAAKCLLAIFDASITEESTEPTNSSQQQPPQQPSPSTSLTAAHAMAKLATTLDPSIAFKQQMTSLVRPFLALARSLTELHQFEALRALTNLASSQDVSVCTRIAALQGLPVLHSLLFSENPRVQCAASETLCNLASFPPLIDFYGIEANYF